MKKSYIVIGCIVLSILMGIAIGILIGIDNKSSQLIENPKTKLAENDNVIVNEIKLVATSSLDIKTTPNTILTFKTFYNECEHTVVSKENIPKEYVNLTKDELQKKYKDWTIQEFTKEEVIFIKDQEGICNEHYIIKDNNGYISIYTIDSNGEEKLKEKTDIVISYLPEADQIELKNGIKVIGKDELNATLEDYE